MRIWVHSPSNIIASAFRELLERLGFDPEPTTLEEADVVLWDLSDRRPPFPSPSSEPTLALIRHEDDAQQLLKQGYRGYLGPRDGPEKLAAALRAVARGEIWASRELLSQTLDSLTAPSLTLREEEVLRLLGKGLSNQKIGEELGIAERTVKAHVSNLLTKFGSKNRTELLLRVHKHLATG